MCHRYKQSCTYDVGQTIQSQAAQCVCISNVFVPVFVFVLQLYLYLLCDGRVQWCEISSQCNRWTSLRLLALRLRGGPLACVYDIDSMCLGLHLCFCLYLCLYLYLHSSLGLIMKSLDITCRNTKVFYFIKYYICMVIGHLFSRNKKELINTKSVIFWSQGAINPLNL